MDVTRLEYQFNRTLDLKDFMEKKKLKNLDLEKTIYIGNIGKLPPRNEAGVVRVRTDDDFAACAELSGIGRTLYERRMAMSIDQKAKEDLSWAASGFAKFGKIDPVEYSTDAKLEDIDFTRLEAMEATYKSYKDQITSTYGGDEQKYHLEELDKSYDSVFESSIAAPLRRIFNNKSWSFAPDDTREMNELRTWTSSRDYLEESLSAYINDQAAKRVDHEDLRNGLDRITGMLGSKWDRHDLDAVKNEVSDLMNIYSSKKKSFADPDKYVDEKAYCDAKAKELSDKYSFDYSNKKLGITEEGVFRGGAEKLDLSKYLKNPNAINMKPTTNGIYMLSFASITGLDNIIKTVAESIRNSRSKAGGQ